jgi:2-polyprenyl-6-methoxyphenol hydroxylase-like FAD-dependent oxidoreductase
MLKFDCPIVSADPESKLLHFVCEKLPVTVKDYDLVLGCDGAYSQVRSIMMRHLRYYLNILRLEWITPKHILITVMSNYQCRHLMVSIKWIQIIYIFGLDSHL